MTTVPDITRLLARIAEWQEAHGKPGGRAEAARRLDQANKLLDEVSNTFRRSARRVSETLRGMPRPVGRGALMTSPIA